MLLGECSSRAEAYFSERITNVFNKWLARAGFLHDASLWKVNEYNSAFNMVMASVKDKLVSLKNKHLINP